MRHRAGYRKLNRPSGHRESLLRNLVSALFQRGYLQTTEAKAKELRRRAEKIITVAKRNDLTARRLILRTVADRELVEKILTQIAPEYKERPGGYIRLTKLGPRAGDAAPMAVVELV